MGLWRGNPRVGGGPYLRALSTIFAIFLLSFIGRWLPSTGGSYSDRFLRGKKLRFSSYRYEAPQDLIIPSRWGRSLEASSIAKATILFHGRDSTYIRAIQSHETHNRRFGYPQFILRHGILDGIWSKTAYLLAILLEELRKPEGQRLKWVCWVDADTVITNPNIPLEIFLPPAEFPYLHLLATADPNGLSNGIFFLKVHPWSIELLSAITSYRLFRPYQDLKYQDQSALIEILKDKKYHRNFALLPQRWFNAYQTERDGSRTMPFQFLPGDLLVHFPGLPDRDERMRHYLNLIENHLPTWEVSLESTYYLNETRDFWAGQHELFAQERSKAQLYAGQAREGLTTIQKQLDAHRAIMDVAEVAHVEQHIKLLTDTLENDRDNLEAVKSAYKKLKAGSKPLRVALHREAKYLLSQAESQLLKLKPLSKGEDVDRHLRAEIDVLKRLLKEKGDDWGGIQGKMEEMRLRLAHKVEESQKPAEKPAS